MADFFFDVVGPETENGTSGDDTFTTANAFFGAGDKAYGMGGTDRFFLFADPTLQGDGFLGSGPKTYAGFILNSVEYVAVTNDSTRALIFDMSNSTGILEVSSDNSSQAVNFDQLTSLVNVRLTDLTFVNTADVSVGFQAAVLAGGNDALTLTLDGTNGDVVRIGASTGVLGSPSNAGVETVNLVGIGGASQINQLDTNLTTLNIIDDPLSSSGIAILTALNTTVRFINSFTDGNVTLSWANNGGAGGVTYVGSNTNSANTLTAGAGNDIITTYGGNDVINGGAGNDTINAGHGNNTVSTGAGNNTVVTGDGNDTVNIQGTVDNVTTGLGNDIVNVTSAGTFTLNTGDGSDLIVATGGVFNASAGNDSLAAGANFDILVVNAGTVDVNYQQVSELDGLAIFTPGNTVLSGNAQNAGINTVYLASGSAGGDNVQAGLFTTGLTVISTPSNSANLFVRLQEGGTGGGTDVVTTGSAADQFLFRGDGNLDDTDMLDGQSSPGDLVFGQMTDALYLEGDTNITVANTAFRNIEFISMESAVGSLYRSQAGVIGNTYSFVLNNSNAPTSGLLTFSGANLKAANPGVNTAETVNINAAAVNTFGLNVLTGAANDIITLGAGTLSSIIQTGDGDDNILDGGGNDTIDTGFGNDTVVLTAGNNTVAALGRAGEVNTITLGTGSDTLYLGGGNDTVLAGTQLTGADTLIDGGGYDTVVINGRNYTDADFAGVNVPGYNGPGQGFERLDVSGTWTYTLGANAQRAGFTMIRATDGGNSTIDVSAWTRAVTVDIDGAGADGNDIVLLGTAQPGTSNLVLFGTGTQQVVGGSGQDIVRVQGAELDALDQFAGNAGYDIVQLDNTLGAVNGVVDLSLFTSVQEFSILASGERGSPDPDANSLTFVALGQLTVNSLTPIVVDTRNLTDGEDSFTMTINAGFNDPDFAFNVFGSSTTTTVVKNNLGINNNIDFQGGSGADFLQIDGGDLGATIQFNGMGGTDVIIQSGGVISDDGYVGVRNVEVLTAVAGGRVRATLGDQASLSGLTTINGTATAAGDQIFFDPDFTTPVTINLGGGGTDQVNGSNTAAALTVNATLAELTAADILQGGTTAGDILNIASNGTDAGNINGVTGFETVNWTVSGPAVSVHTLTLDTLLAEVTGGTQTINIFGGNFANDQILQAGTATANLVVNASGDFDQIKTGSGNDIINVSDAFNRVNAGAGNDTITASGVGNDQLYGWSGNDTINAGAGNDQISGDDDAYAFAGNDILNGDAGNDIIRGQGGNDTIHGGADNDTIYGGLGADVIWGDGGADVYLYAGLQDSPFNGRDTVHVDTLDQFDFRGLIGATGNSVAFKGSYATFEDAQSAVVTGDNVIDVVFNQASGRLWVDLNDDGTLDGNDLQINVVFDGGAVNITSAHIIQGATTPGSIAAFDALFAPAI